MSNKYLIVFLGVLLFCGCDEARSKVEGTSFQFKINNTLTGEITDKEGVVTLECKDDRVVLFFKEAIEDKTSSADDLIGEIILGFQIGDTTGLYPLNEISGKREVGKVGIVAFLDVLEFDDLAAQYISNPIRYELVEDGSVEITEWSTVANGILKGKLKTVLGNREDKVEIEATFSIKWDAENINCE